MALAVIIQSISATVHQVGPSLASSSGRLQSCRSFGCRRTHRHSKIWGPASSCRLRCHPERLHHQRPGRRPGQLQRRHRSCRQGHRSWQKQRRRHPRVPARVNRSGAVAHRRNHFQQHPRVNRSGAVGRRPSRLQLHTVALDLRVRRDSCHRLAKARAGRWRRGLQWRMGRPHAVWGDQHRAKVHAALRHAGNFADSALLQKRRVRPHVVWGDQQRAKVPAARRHGREKALVDLFLDDEQHQCQHCPTPG